jgi:hypothetical protein
MSVHSCGRVRASGVDSTAQAASGAPPLRRVVADWLLPVIASLIVGGLALTVLAGLGEDEPSARDSTTTTSAAGALASTPASSAGVRARRAP